VRQTGYRGWRVAGVLGALAAACDGTSGNYEASVVALERDARASVQITADGGVELWLRRWYGSEAFGWERCPVLHAEATVDGEPMEVVSAGGWVPLTSGPTILDSSGGHCEAMHYRLLDPPPELLHGESLLIELRDEGGAIAIEVALMGTLQPSPLRLWQLPVTRCEGVGGCEATSERAPATEHTRADISVVQEREQSCGSAPRARRVA
jgi:hypothetical protein